MNKIEILSCHQNYNNAKAKYMAQIEDFDEGDDDDTNEVIKAHLKKMVDLIDSMAITDDAEIQINDACNELNDLLNGKAPIQSLVFHFNAVEGEIQFSTYGSLDLNKLQPTELSLGNKIDNEVMGPMGPISFCNYYEILEDAVYFDELEECSLDDENDYLRELCGLKALALFETIFSCINMPKRLTHASLLFPFYIYIQEHDGGFSNRLDIIEN